MSDVNQLDWKSVIEGYIDGLGEQEKQNEYIDELLSIFISKKLLSDLSGDDEKSINKLLGNVKKTPATAKNKDKFLSFYQSALDNGWIKSISDIIEKISHKSNFCNIWISRSIEISEGILPATHCAKLTHSSSSGSSILDESGNSRTDYISTSSLQEKIIDGTYPNATLSKQVKFLMLEHNGSYLFQEIQKSNSAVFSYFSENDGELYYWIKSYQAILSEKPKTDILLKQLYFPVAKNHHLLTVLQSSSLAQQLYEQCFDKEIRKKREQFTKARKSNKFIPDPQQNFIGVSKILITQSQHQNATVLNGKRGGIQRLFNSQPPSWLSQVKPPVYQKSWFYRGIPHSAVQTNIDYLRDFLLRNEKLSLSTRNPQKRKWLIKWGQSLTDAVLFYAQQIQMLPAGWTETDNIKLKSSQQYFLDPYRGDDVFQTARKSTNWQLDVSKDFAKWMNGKLIGKDKQFTPQTEHSKLWVLLMSNALRELNPVLEIVKKLEETA
ncbi:type I-F CRISPR-associated protein Csy1 [Shewanella algidipiscicola]|uniref:type I-F CRISPR-associated protein Csy1 n=1 Tax=Shewanella algidipiscicola TaxID=614070 RepID=UPI0013A56540|nr:type I-F CRISPR-associated protein Csy1 [Shewanella algidipiscicola]